MDVKDLEARVAALEAAVKALACGEQMYDEELMVREAAKGNFGPMKEWSRRQRGRQDS